MTAPLTFLCLASYHKGFEFVRELPVPVVLGGGKKLFADGSAPHAYKLTRSRVSSTGIMIGHYERDGEIKIGGTALDSPSEREIARQERMKREG